MMQQGRMAGAGPAYLVGERGPEMYVPEQGRPQMVGRDGPEVMVPSRDGIVIPFHILQLALKLGLTLEQTLGLLHELQGGGTGPAAEPGAGGLPSGPGAGVPQGPPPGGPAGGLRLVARAGGGAVEGTDDPELRRRIGEIVLSALSEKRGAAGGTGGPDAGAPARDETGDTSTAGLSGQTSATNLDDFSASMRDGPRTTGLDPAVMAADGSDQAFRGNQRATASTTGGPGLRSQGMASANPAWGFSETGEEPRPFSIPAALTGLRGRG